MAPAKKKAPAKPVKKAKPGANPLFQAEARSYRIGGSIRYKKDLSRFVKWPRYIRLQRQKKILYQRLKVPPSITQFNKTINKNEATELFKLLSKYIPETKAAKKERLKELAVAKEAGKKLDVVKKNVLKFGLKHVTELITEKKVSLVAIAHDVNPIELVVWLPALCRKQGIPFCIVKGKSRLGQLVHQKNAAVVALPATVNREDKGALENLQKTFKEEFNDKRDRTWGGGIMGLKTQKKLEIREKLLAAEAAKKAKY